MSTVHGSQGLQAKTCSSFPAKFNVHSSVESCTVLYQQTLHVLLQAMQSPSSFLQWAQQHNCLDLELPNELPNISPCGLQWRLGSHKGTVPGVALQQAVHQLMVAAS